MGSGATAPVYRGWGATTPGRPGAHTFRAEAQETEGAGGAGKRLTQRPESGSRVRNARPKKSLLLGVDREAEVDAAVARIEPAGRDRLPAGVEVDALGAVHVRVAEQRGLPAAE